MGKKGFCWNKGLPKEAQPVYGKRWRRKTPVWSEGQKLLYVSERNLINNPMRDPEVRERQRKSVSEAMTKLWQNREYRQRQKAARKRTWDTETEKRLLEASFKGPTQTEQVLIELIEDNQLPYRYVGDGSLLIGIKNPDFINTRSEPKVIELFGNYWHSNPGTLWHRTAEGCLKIYSEYGYQCLIIWERELASVAVVIEKIRQF